MAAHIITIIILLIIILIILRINFNTNIHTINSNDNTNTDHNTNNHNLGRSAGAQAKAGGMGERPRTCTMYTDNACIHTVSQHIRTRRHLCLHAAAHIHTSTYPHVHERILATHTHPCIIHAYIHACIRAYVHTCIHAYCSRVTTP